MHWLREVSHESHKHCWPEPKNKFKQNICSTQTNKIIGFDGMPDGKKAIKKGQIYADPIQHPDKMGQKIVELICKYENGLGFSRETLLPATLYTQKDALEDPDLK